MSDKGATGKDKKAGKDDRLKRLKALLAARNNNGSDESAIQVRNMVFRFNDEYIFSLHCLFIYFPDGQGKGE